MGLGSYLPEDDPPLLCLAPSPAPGKGDGVIFLLVLLRELQASYLVESEALA
jgi:hypothetical protein